MIRVVLFLICLVTPLITSSQEIKKDSILLFYLGGQSNMDGFGMNAELPDSLKTEFKNVWIFHGNPVGDKKMNGGLGKWETLKPGHGYGFSSDGIRNIMSNKFGCELSFARKLQKQYPNQKIALIKYSRSGTAIDSFAGKQYGSWETNYPGINQYDHFLKTVQNAFHHTDIDSNGVKDTLIPSGILWMQGENDASFTEEIANRYYKNLKRLINLIRKTLRKDDIPVIIGKISDSWHNADKKVYKYGELVQYAQEKYARTDKNAKIIRDTRYYKYSDTWHYDSKGYIDLGIKFAEALILLNNK